MPQSRRRSTSTRNKDKTVDIIRAYFNKVSDDPIDMTEDIINNLTDDERAYLPLTYIPLRKARRALALYMARKPLAVIASQLSMDIDEVKRTLHIVNEPCAKCGTRRIGDVTKVGNAINMCRKCRRRLDI